MQSKDALMGHQGGLGGGGRWGGGHGMSLPGGQFCSLRSTWVQSPGFGERPQVLVSSLGCGPLLYGSEKG